MKRLFLGIMSGFFLQVGFAAETITYESVNKRETSKTFWTLDRQKDAVRMVAVKEEKEVVLACLPDFSLLEYSEKKKDGKEFHIVKTGPCLIVKNFEPGKEKIVSHKIGSMPWVQEFSFGFASFIESKNKEYEFCIVYPKDLALHEMVAVKQGEEAISVGNKKYDTYKVKITLTGFKKRFWKAYGWFDKKSGLMVQYRANEGPGTPYTETSLIEGSL